MHYTIALGSNLGDREASILDAAQRLASLADGPLCLSGLYETAPMYRSDQPPFVNAVAAFEAALDPSEMLLTVLDIETAMGRVRSERFGPRPIDLDIIAAGSTVVSLDDLSVPHPLLHERAFVLMPMLDVAPQWTHPLLGRSVGELLAALADGPRYVAPRQLVPPQLLPRPCASSSAAS